MLWESPILPLGRQFGFTSVLDGDADVRAACGVLCELSYFWNTVGWNHWAHGRGRKSPADSHIEWVQSPPSPPAGTSPSGARPIRHAGPVRKTELFSQHTFVHPLSPPVKLSLSSRAFTVVFPTKALPLPGLFHLSAGGRNRMNITHLGLYKIVNKYNG